jgi:hypothetical protein
MLLRLLASRLAGGGDSPRDRRVIMSKRKGRLLLAFLPILFVACAKEKESDLPELPPYVPMAEAGPPLPFEQCVTKAWEIEMTAQREWYQGQRNLAASRYPEVAGAVDLGLQYQLLRIDQRQARLRYLIESHPDRLVIDSGATAFKNLDWQEADTAALAEKDASYSTIENRLLELNRQYNEHPQHQRALDLFRDDLQRTEHYGDLVDRLEARDREIEQTLERCEANARVAEAEAAGATGGAEDE